MNDYYYRPLESERHIRLLQLATTPGSEWTEAQQMLPALDIIHVPVDSAPPYNAVSYTWGDQERNSRIPLISGSIRGTLTLTTMLPYLIRQTSTGYLWIDQICINQEDPIERSKQVLLMADIYKTTLCTLIWLCEEEFIGTTLEPFTSFLRHFAFPLPGSNQPPELRAEAARKLEYDTKHLREGFNFNIHDLENMSLPVQAVRVLFALPWFKRAWVFQEIVCSKRAEFVFGSVAIEARDLYGVVEAFSAASIDLQHPDKVSNMITSLPGHTALTRMFGAIDAGYENARSEPSLFWLHSIANSTEASNPRDYVYAFLNLLNDQRYQIIPDYSLSPSEVFLGVARSIMAGAHTLDILALSTGLHVDAEIPLPSWAPNWGARITDTHLMYGPNPSVPFCAGGTFPHLPRASPNPLYLLLRGRSVHVIRRILKSLPTGAAIVDSSHWRTMFQFDEFCDKFDQENHVPSKTTLPKPSASLISQSNDLRERLFATMIAGGAAQLPSENPAEENPRTFPLTRERTRDLLYAFDLNSSLGAGDDEPGTTDRLARINEYSSTRSPALSMEEISEILADLRFCLLITDRRAIAQGEDGSIGLVPDGSQEGDLIFILHGSKVPLVLRSTGVKHQYKVVGQCYWEDLMYGEGLTWAEGDADDIVLV